MLKRKRSQAEEEDETTRCPYSMSLTKAFGRNATQFVFVSDETIGLLKKRQKKENVVKPEESLQLNAEIVEDTALPSTESSVSENLQTSLTCTSSKGRIPSPSKRVDFECAQEVSQTLSNQGTSKELGQNYQLSLGRRLCGAAQACSTKHLISDKSSRRIVTRLSEWKEQERKLKTRELTSLNAHMTRADLEFSSKVDGATSSKGKVRRSAREGNNVKYFCLKRRKMRSAKNIKSGSKKPTGTSRKSVQSKISKKRKYKSKASLPNKLKNIKRVMKRIHKSKGQTAKMKNDFNSSSSGSEQQKSAKLPLLCKNKFCSYPVSKCMRDHHLSRGTKLRTRNHSSCAVHATPDKASIVPKISTDVNSGSVDMLNSRSQSVSVQNQKSEYTQVASKMCEESLSDTRKWERLKKKTEPDLNFHDCGSEWPKPAEPPAWHERNLLSLTRKSQTHNHNFTPAPADSSKADIVFKISTDVFCGSSTVLPSSGSESVSVQKLESCNTQGNICAPDATEQQESVASKMCEKRSYKSHLRVLNELKNTKKVMNTRRWERRMSQAKQDFNSYDCDSKQPKTAGLLTRYNNRWRSSAVSKYVNARRSECTDSSVARANSAKADIVPVISSTENIGLLAVLNSGSLSFSVQNFKTEHAQDNTCIPRVSEETESPLQICYSSKEKHSAARNLFVRLKRLKINARNRAVSSSVNFETVVSRNPRLQFSSRDYQVSCNERREICCISKSELEVACSKFAHVEFQNLLEILQLLTTKRSVFSSSAQSRDINEHQSRKCNLSFADAICCSIKVLTVKMLWTLAALNSDVPKARGSIEMCTHILSGLRNRLLHECRSSKTSYGFLIVAKEVLLRPFAFIGLGDFILESSLARYLSGSKRCVQQVCNYASCASKTRGVREVISDSTGSHSSQSCDSMGNACAKTQKSSVFEPLEVLEQPVSKRKFSKRRMPKSSRKIGSYSSYQREESKKVHFSTAKRRPILKKHCSEALKLCITPQERQIQITLDKCLKNKELNKLPKVKTTQELVNELFHNSSYQMPVSLEKYCAFPRKCDIESETSVSSVQTCVDNSLEANELAGKYLASGDCAGHDTLKTMQAETPLLQLDMQENEVGTISSEISTASRTGESAAEGVQGDDALELSDIEILEHLPSKGQDGEWHVECVDGNFDCYGNWKQLHECCQKDSGNGEKLLILPWINLGW